MVSGQFFLVILRKLIVAEDLIDGPTHRNASYRSKNGPEGPKTAKNHRFSDAHSNEFAEKTSEVGKFLFEDSDSRQNSTTF